MLKIVNEKTWIDKKEEWNSLVEKLKYKSIFLTWEWSYCYWKNFGKGKKLLIFFYEKRGEIKAIAPFFIEKKFLGLKFLKFLATGVSDNIDFIVEEGFRDIFLKKLFQYLNTHSWMWDIIDFGEFSSDSPNLNSLLTILRENKIMVKLINTTVYPQMDINNSWQDFTKNIGSKYRKTIRNRLNRIKKKHNLEFTHYKNLNGKAFPLLEKIIKIDRNSSKYKSHDSLFSKRENINFHRDIFKILVPKEQIDLSILSLNGNPISYVYNFKFADSIYCYDTSYDFKYHNFSPGNLVIYLLFKDYFSSPYLRYIKLGRGLSENKKRFMSHLVLNYRLFSAKNIFSKIVIILYVFWLKDLKSIIRKFPFLHLFLFKVKRGISIVFY
jgi:CelD/BcsL family acetyltransferase involved in cellulose biosynthesis